jgi:hypothetical protein
MKHLETHFNKVFIAETDRFLAEMKKTNTFNNAQVTGRNGELLILNFLQTYLPSMFSVKTGKFINLNKRLSPQIDILILDARFPLLSNNIDGSVIAPLHAVISTIEVKSRLCTREIQNIEKSHTKIVSIRKTLHPDTQKFTHGGYYSLSYFAGNTLKHYLKNYFDKTNINIKEIESFILKVKDSDVDKYGKTGAILRHERRSDENIMSSSNILSDFYYMLIQDSIQILASRNYDLNNLDRIVGQYFNWCVETLHYKKRK